MTHFINNYLSEAIRPARRLNAIKLRNKRERANG